MAELPGHARVVIIGGGAVGASALYHLAQVGWRDAVLIERNELTSGSTWHAAGNCPNFSGSWSIMKLQSYSTALYRRLGDEVGYPIGYHVTGAVRLAHSLERMREFEKVVAMARHQGIDFEMLQVADLRDRYPFVETHDLAGGSWDPLDGDIDPAQLTQAFARGARDAGAKIVRFCPVTGVRRQNGEWVVETGKGEIACEYVVNAAGYRAQEVGRWFLPYGGRDVPQTTLSHQYLITEPIRELAARDAKLPILRDPDSSYYLRQEKDGLLLGPYERSCRAHWTSASDPMPDDFSFQLWAEDLERLEWYIEDACRRVPILGSVGLTRTVNGPIPYAPDGNPLVGPMPGVPNAFEACVFTFGIVQAGGAGKVLAEWVTEGETEWDMWSCDPRRFTSFADQAYADAKGLEIYGHEYAIGFPRYQWPEGRNKRVSPLYGRLEELGAQFMASAGWERAAWYARPGDDTNLEACETYEREGPWFGAVGEECLAVRDAAGLCELPGFSRFEVVGEGAAAWLAGMITGVVPAEGRVGLVYFADDRGRIVTEMTAHRTDRGVALLTGAGAEWHDRDWLADRLPGDGSLALVNHTEEHTCLVLSGPKSREILRPLCDADLSRPWLSHQTCQIAGADVQLMRVSYVGELGWEVHCALADAPAVFDALWQVGAPHGLRPFGLYAVDSLRLEKGYRSWKQDLSTDYTMLEGGLDRFVRFDKPAFTGKVALQRQARQGVAQRFAPLIVEAGDCDAPYLATVWKGDERVGLVTSGGWGYRLGKSIAISVIRADLAKENQEVEVDIFGERRPAVVQADRPLWDPDNARLRG
jgi:dimethylglycine dehydrogenase